MVKWEKRQYGSLTSYRKHKIGEIGIDKTWNPSKKKYETTVGIYKSDGSLTGKAKLLRKKYFQSKKTANEYAKKYMKKH